MTLVEAKEIFLNRGYIQVKGGRIYDGDKWRESVVVISKWLEQEPCDCISRKAVLDMAEDMTDQFGNKHRVVTEGLISMLPPVKPKPKTGHWIPVSERLPDAQKEFGDKNFSDWVQVCIRINAYQSIVCSAYYCFSEKKWYMERMGCGEILAWMPLPEPYTTEKE